MVILSLIKGQYEITWADGYFRKISTGTDYLSSNNSYTDILPTSSPLEDLIMHKMNHHLTKPDIALLASASRIKAKKFPAIMKQFQLEARFYRKYSYIAFIALAAHKKMVDVRSAVKNVLKENNFLIKDTAYNCKNEFEDNCYHLMESLIPEDIATSDAVERAGPLLRAYGFNLRI